MAMQEVSTLIHDSKKWPNKPLTGYYIGSTSYEDPTYHKTQYVHNFRKEDGTEISIYGYTTLDSRIAKVPVGVLCQVTYLGTENVQTKKYGQKDVHQCSVMMDTSQRLSEYEHLGAAPAAKAPDAAPVGQTQGARKATGKAVAAPAADDDPPF